MSLYGFCICVSICLCLCLSGFVVSPGQERWFPQGPGASSPPSMYKSVQLRCTPPFELLPHVRQVIKYARRRELATLVRAPSTSSGGSRRGRVEAMSSVARRHARGFLPTSPRRRVSSWEDQHVWHGRGCLRMCAVSRCDTPWRAHSRSQASKVITGA